MKYFTYIAISVMVIALISLFYLKKPNGQPWLTSTLIKNESFSIKDEMVALSSNILEPFTLEVKKAADQLTSSSLSSDGQVKIYKWQDELGQWHFSDVPNKNGKSVAVTLNLADSNVVVAEDTAILSGSAKSAVDPFPQRAPEIYNSQSIKKLFEDAEKAKQRLEQRSKEVESFSGF